VTALDPPAPGLFAKVVGQRAAVAVLRAAARAPVHAYLFCGPPGSGRRTAARAFAAALLCPDGGCGACDTCRQALAGSHPDLVTVERTGASLGVEEVRKLVGLAQRKPYVAARQVLVVADVHLATRSAPALLKTVEEPPLSTVFVLLAETVPPELETVASRCVEVTFPPLPPEEIARWLVGRGVLTAQAELVADGAGGDLDRARLLAEDDGFATRLDLWRSVPSRLDGHGATAGALAVELLAAAELALAPLRARHAEELRALAAGAEAMGERGVPGRKEVTDRQHREERRWEADELRAGLGVLARAYRDRLVDSVSGTGAAGASTGATVAHVVQSVDVAIGYENAIGLITEAAAALRRNPNESLLLEALLVRLGNVGG
jgi:DNA polymerase-3 subunit delta'